MKILKQEKQKGFVVAGSKLPEEMKTLVRVKAKELFPDTSQSVATDSSEQAQKSIWNKLGLNLNKRD